MGDGCAHGRGVDRRNFLGLLAAGALAALGACAPARGRTASTAQVPPTAPLPPRPIGPAIPVVPIPPPRPGAPVVLSAPPKGARTFALTIDDGYCVDCVAAYVDFAARTGLPITFSPNGAYRASWDPHAARLRPLVAAGQVQIANHTWSHHRLTGRREADIVADIERNEEWIQAAFGVTARPYFRPPYGARSRRTDEVAASLGYTSILLWNGSLGDAVELTPAALMAQAECWFRPGTIVLGHANHPTVTALFDQLTALLATRGIQPVTLDTMFGTSRATG